MTEQRASVSASTEVKSGIAVASSILAIIITLTMIVTPDSWVGISIAISVFQIIIMSWLRSRARTSWMAPLAGLAVLALGWAQAFSFLAGGESIEGLVEIAVDSFATDHILMSASPAVQLTLIFAVGLATVLIDFIARTAALPAGALALVFLPTVPIIGLGVKYQPLLVVVSALFCIPLLLLDQEKPFNGMASLRPRRTGNGRAFVVAGVLFTIAIVVAPSLSGLPGRGTLSPQANSGIGSANTPARLARAVDMRGELGERSDQPILTYSLAGKQQTEPWRVLVFGEFMNNTWSELGNDPDSAQAAFDALADSSNAVGVSDDKAEDWREVKVKMSRLQESIAPLPYPARRISLVEHGWFPRSGALMYQAPEGASLLGEKYSFTTSSIVTTAADLSLLDATQPPADTSASMPVEIPDSIEKKALEVTAGAASDYDKLLAIQDFLRSPKEFSYRETGVPETSSNAMDDFLKLREGYCIHFATAMTLMGRSLDIPIRYVEGFLPGNRNSAGDWQITPRDQHAWTEAYFEGFGWIRFEPTPASRSGRVPAWQNSTPKSETTTTAPTSSTTSQTPSGQNTTKTDAGAGKDGSTPSWPIAILIVVVVAVFGFGVTVIAHRRDAARRRSPWPERVEFAWSQARRIILSAGYSWPRTWSPGQVVVAYGPDSESPTESMPPYRVREMLTTLAQLLEETRYAAELQEHTRSPESIVAEIRKNTFRQRLATRVTRIFQVFRHRERDKSQRR